MPLVQRVILPKLLSRRPKSWGVTETGEEVTFQGDYDLTAVTNVTLCGALQQLASLLHVAERIHNDLDGQLADISLRSQMLAHRLQALEHTAEAHNPKTVAVPEGDLRTFSERKKHYESSKTVTEMLFTVESRPETIQKLYDDAAETPVRVIREIDRFRDDGLRSSMYFTCKPVFGDSLKRERLKSLLDIETRRPASFVALREWGSDDETLLSEVELAPVSPATPLRPPPAPHPPDLKLPLPEERQLALSYKYPPQLVPIDVSGRGFRRMELFRQSLVQFEYVKNRKRRRRLKRRNTIANTREVRSALTNATNLPSTSSGQGISSTRSGSPSSRCGLSSYTDRSFDTSSTKTSSEREVGPRSHCLGLDISVPTPPRNVFTLSRHLTKDSNSFRVGSMSQHDNDILNSLPQSSPREHRKCFQARDNNNFEDVTSENGCSIQSRTPQIAKQSAPKLPISSSSSAINMAVKLREGNSRDEGTRSSSGNWSASSSTRTSLESDLQQQHSGHTQKQFNSTVVGANRDHIDEGNAEGKEEHERVGLQEKVTGEKNGAASDHPPSPTSSLDQESFLSESYQIRSSSPSSNQGTTSRTTDDFPSSSPHTSDGTLTPTQDIQDIPFLDDDTGSAFSCDTEGYYTSFHIDSGLRSVSYEGNKLASDNDTEVYFGRGSTGTTNSSASLGTVVMRNPEKKTPPKPPQRVSSLERKDNRESIITVIHVNGSTSSREDVAGAEGSDGRDSRSSKECDSGRETSSSPADAMSPRQPSVFSPEPAEYSEGDPDSAERKESFRMKTAINASGIPSMCVITPPQSDDESVRSGSFQLTRDSPQGGQEKPSAGADSRVIRKPAVSFQPSNKSVSFNTPCTTAIRQPGDGAVAPSIPSSSPSFTAHSTQQGYTPTLTVMSQHRAGELSAHLKVFSPQESSAPPKPQPDFYSLGRSVSERRAEIQLKVLGERKPSSDVLLQRQNSREGASSAHATEATNLVSYKELPATATSTPQHPFSAIPASVKQGVVSTPTNSLERRKTNTKPGAHVMLDSEGKVVYSSDSLPRRKGHTSFEPGPYIKPPPIASASSNGSQPKTRLPGVSSIQSMPLPPLPGQQSNSSSPAPAIRTQEKSLDAPASTPQNVTPQQPKLGTRSQISAISHTLSGLSSHMQPRTISQINSIRSSHVKSPKTVSQESPRSMSEEGPPTHEAPKTEAPLAAPQQTYQKMQEGTTPSAASLLRKSSSLGREESQSQEVERLTNQRQALQQNLQTTQQPPQLQTQLQQLLQHQPSQLTFEQTQQKLQQQQEHNQLLLQQQLQLQQQQKQQILQQQHIELQKQLEQQQQQLQQHKAQQARQAEQQKQIQLNKDTAQTKSLQMDSMYQTRQDYQRQQLVQLQQQQQQQQLAAYQQQHSLYQAQDDPYLIRQQQIMQQNQQLSQQLRAQNGSQVPGPTEVILATQGAPMSPQSQRGAYTSIQSKLPQPAGQEPGTQMDPAVYPARPQSAQGYLVGTTSRAPTPIQGLSTSSPQRLPTSSPSLQHQNLRTNSGLMYGSQRSLQNISMGADGRGTPIPRPLSTSPPPYDHYNVTNSDIYGRIGMTRQVQVGGTLPAGFGRNQRNYSSLPPNLRQPLTPSEVLAQQQQQVRIRQQYSGAKTLTRRASVAGTESSNVKVNASNPNTPEKALDKKEKGSRREKEKEKEKEKDKRKEDKVKKEKDAKTEKSPKKKWFWTLPLRRKKKSKDEENTEDDDGGFKDVSNNKTVRKVVPSEDTSFIRYPSPDTGSSDLNSSYSSDMSSGEHGYRSSPSSEVYYYSQRAQLIQQQQAVGLSIAPTMGSAVSLGTVPNTSLSITSIPRSNPTTPVSPSDPQMMIPGDGTDLTDLSKSRRYMSRDEMYAAMRHPQYYNMNRNSIPGMPAEFSQNSTPTSSRSNSPAVFGINPPPPYVVRPQVREGFQIGSDKSLTTTALYPSENQLQTDYITRMNDREDNSGGNEIEPPAAYREAISTSPTESQEGENTSFGAGQSSSSKTIAKQTTLLDFKKMVLEKSMSTAGGRERVSAVEMLRASRPSIYGYSPPPAPMIVKSQESELNLKGEGIIMPPNSRNTARALLFQSRFGSGRRFRSPKTEIISTTIIEDKMEEEEERTYEEDSEGSEDEDLSSSTTSSQERRSVQSVRGPLARAYSEPANQKSSNGSPPSDKEEEAKKSSHLHNTKSQNSDSNGSKVAHSTPIKPHHIPPQAPDVSIILPQSEDDSVSSKTQKNAPPSSPDKESVETSL